MSASVTTAGHAPHRYAMSRHAIGPWSGQSTVTGAPGQAGRLISTTGFYHASRRSHDPSKLGTVPGYYDGKDGMQPFDVIDAFGLDFYEGNVVKYLVRWRKKGGVEDLRKARTYIDEIIKRAEAQAQASSGGTGGGGGGGEYAGPVVTRVQ